MKSAVFLASFVLASNVLANPVDSLEKVAAFVAATCLPSGSSCSSTSQCCPGLSCTGSAGQSSYCQPKTSTTTKSSSTKKVTTTSTKTSARTSSSPSKSSSSKTSSSTKTSSVSKTSSLTKTTSSSKTTVSTSTTTKSLTTAKPTSKTSTTKSSSSKTTSSLRTTKSTSSSKTTSSTRSTTTSKATSSRTSTKSVSQTTTASQSLTSPSSSLSSRSESTTAESTSQSTTSGSAVSESTTSQSISSQPTTSESATSQTTISQSSTSSQSPTTQSTTESTSVQPTTSESVTAQTTVSESSTASQSATSQSTTESTTESTSTQPTTSESVTSQTTVSVSSTPSPSPTTESTTESTSAQPTTTKSVTSQTTVSESSTVSQSTTSQSTTESTTESTSAQPTTTESTSIQPTTTESVTSPTTASASSTSSQSSTAQSTTQSTTQSSTESTSVPPTTTESVTSQTTVSVSSTVSQSTTTESTTSQSITSQSVTSESSSSQSITTSPSTTASTTVSSSTTTTTTTSSCTSPTASVTAVTCSGSSYVYEELSGYGFVPSNAVDKLGDTLGGFGSSIAFDPASWTRDGDVYTGIMYGLPDRGWNTQGTLNYQSRIQKFRIQFALNCSATAANPATPNIGITFLDTIVLATPDGNPSTGLDADVKPPYATLFGAEAPSATYPGDGFGGAGPGGQRVSIDAEGLVLRSDGSFWVSDEYGPYVYDVSASGVVRGVVRPPPVFIPLRNGSTSFASNNPPVYDSTRAVIPANPTSGRSNNQGLEGLTASPDGTRLYGLMQSALYQEGGSSSSDGRKNARFLVYDTTTSPPSLIHEYVVTLPTYTNNNGNKRIAAQSEIKYISPTQFLILSRDSGSGHGAGFTKSIYRHADIFDISAATDIIGQYDTTNAAISSSSGKLVAGITAATYCPFVDYNINAQLNRFGIYNDGPQSANLLNEKWESLALLPVNPGDATSSEYFLFTVSDNDFITQNGFMNGGAYPYADGSGYNLDSQVLAFRVKLPVGSAPRLG